MVGISGMVDLTPSALFAVLAMNFSGYYVYARESDRWRMSADGLEYWIIEDELGSRVVEVI